jgi:hypothetical protein
MSKLFYTQIFPGMEVQALLYQENPSAAPFVQHQFYDEYWEVVCTVTKENLSVCESRKSLLLVKPYAHTIGILGTDGEYTYIGIGKDETLASIGYAAQALQTDRGEVEVDIVLLGLVTADNLARHIPILFEHNKEAWLEGLQAGGIFGNSATP